MNTSDLDAAWDELVIKKATELGLSTELSRVELAARILAIYKEEYQAGLKERDYGRSWTSQSTGALIWQLLSADLAGWFLNPNPDFIADPFEDKDLWKGRTQELLANCVGLQRHHADIIPTEPHDWASVSLPVWLLRSLDDALEALSEGEVQDILKPAATGRHGDAWSWNRDRVKAVEHVFFLTGQGLTKGTAQRRVQQLTGISAETLRRWEKDFHDVRAKFHWAKELGKTKARLDDDPAHGRGKVDSLVAMAIMGLKKFQEETLAEFGDRYRQQHGNRHNQPQSGGD